MHRPRNASAGASVEKIFDLGKTDTVPAVCDVVCVIKCDFHRAREIKIEFADMRENIDSIRVFDVSKNLRVIASRTLRVDVVRDVGVRRASEQSKADSAVRVHRPLSGVGVFSVALV